MTAHTDPRGEAAWTDRAEPPHWGTGWRKVEGTDLLWYTWLRDGPGDPHLWHWCTAEKWIAEGRQHTQAHWGLSGTRAHTLVSRDPLTLSPSVYWPDCCGLHGFITAGAWVGA